MPCPFNGQTRSKILIVAESKSIKGGNISFVYKGQDSNDSLMILNPPYVLLASFGFWLLLSLQVGSEQWADQMSRYLENLLSSRISVVNT